MKTLISIAILSLVGFWSITSWTISEDYVLSFDTAGAEGTFQGLEGDIVFDPAAPEAARMNVSVAVKTIDTGNSTKDGHALGEKWFDVDNYPKIRFVSSSVKKSTQGYVVTGKLSLHGVERSVEVPFTFQKKDGEGLFAGAFEVDRKDYGIDGGFFGFLVGDTVEIKLRVPVHKQ